MGLSKLQKIVKDREACFTAVHGVVVRHDLATEQQLAVCILLSVCFIICYLFLSICVCIFVCILYKDTYILFFFCMQRWHLTVSCRHHVPLFLNTSVS